MPKGDADNLRADLDDGFARCANLLVEILCSSPLAASELRVALFVIRRTYGWAKEKDRQTGKMTIMTGEDVAAGTGLLLRTARSAITELVKKKVLIQVRTADHPGSKCAYGINPDCASWGEGRDWIEARINHREASHAGLYITEKHVMETGTITGKTVIVQKNITGKTVMEQASSPTGTGADSALQTERPLQTERQRHTAPVGAVQLEGLPETPKTADHEKPVPACLAAANACLAVWGLSHKDLDATQKRRYYAAMNKLVSDVEAGVEGVQAWADTAQRRTLGSKANPATVIPAEVRKAITAKGWSQAFSDARNAARNKGKLWRARPDGTPEYEDTMDAGQIQSILRADVAGTWDHKLGMDWSCDDRHPDYPHGPKKDPVT